MDNSSATIEKAELRTPENLSTWRVAVEEIGVAGEVRPAASDVLRVKGRGGEVASRRVEGNQVEAYVNRTRVEWAAVEELDDGARPQRKAAVANSERVGIIGERNLARRKALGEIVLSRRGRSPWVGIPGDGEAGEE